VDSAGFSQSAMPIYERLDLIAFVYIVSCVLVRERSLLQTLRFYSIVLFISELLVIAMVTKGNSQKDKKSR
jgi:hypothetical protein